jgi:hypothetical protein
MAAAVVSSVAASGRGFRDVRHVLPFNAISAA